MTRRFSSVAGGDLLLVGRSAIVPPRDEATIYAWLREVAADERSRAALVQLAQASADVDDDDAVTRVLQTLARALASGELALVRLDEPKRTLDPPRTVPLASLSDEPLAPIAPATPSVAATTWFELRVVDPFGAPLAGIDVVLDDDGDTHRTRTDGDGRIRLDPARGPSAYVSIAATQRLRDGLREVWARPAAEPMLGEDDGVTVLRFRDDLLGPVRLDAEQPKTLSIQPFVVLGRLVGMFFDTARDFLLPISREAIAELRALYDRCAPCQLLVVGHTDTVGSTDTNAELSLARARSVKAFLTDDVDAWLSRYDAELPGAGRWGQAEDRHMLEALRDGSQRPPGTDPIRWFQQTRGLQDDGILGPKTRRVLIAETMQFDGTTLPAGVEIRVHGCGDAFPLDASGHELDEAPVDGNDDPIDRRVELLFFGDSLGIQPPPPGETSAAGTDAYPTWRRRAHQTHQHVLGAHALEVELTDEDDQPIPHARYAVRLPMGVVVDGQLDGQGRARVERLPPGTVRVDFPELGRGFMVAATTALTDGH